MAVRKIQTKRRCICYTRKASKNEENLRTQAHDVESVRITRLDDGEKLRKREYSRELLSIYGEEVQMEGTLYRSTQPKISFFLEQLANRWMKEARESIKPYEELLEQRARTDHSAKTQSSLLTCTLPLCCRCIRNINVTI